jgi:hypothetical protein
VKEIARLGEITRHIVLATQHMRLADNGGDWFISGAPDKRWMHDELTPIRKVKGKDFEVVKMGPMTTR